jgi:hypothetical protein
MPQVTSSSRAAPLPAPKHELVTEYGDEFRLLRMRQGREKISTKRRRGFWPLLRETGLPPTGIAIVPLVENLCRHSAVLPRNVLGNKIDTVGRREFGAA